MTWLSIIIQWNRQSFALERSLGGQWRRMWKRSLKHYFSNGQINAAADDDDDEEMLINATYCRYVKCVYVCINTVFKRDLNVRLNIQSLIHQFLLQETSKNSRNWNLTSKYDGWMHIIGRRKKFLLLQRQVKSYGRGP